jgi:outer membrane protein TolC
MQRRIALERHLMGEIMSKPILAAFLLVLAAAASRAQQPTAASVPKQELSLEQAVALALERNPALAAVHDEARAAQARVGQARSAFFPRLDVSQGFTRGNNPVYVFGTLLTQRHFTQASFALPLLNAPTPLDNFQTRLDGEMLLFDSGQTYFRTRSAKGLASAADFAAEQERQDLILRVVRAYYGVIVAREDSKAAEEALRTAEANEARVRSMEKAGLVVSSDLLSAQVFRAEMQDRVIRARNAVEVARLELARELGVAPDALGDPAGSLPEPQPVTPTIEQWEKTALANRPVLQAAEFEEKAAAANRQAARAKFGPRLGLFADLERDAETLGGPSGTNWTAGARLELNLFAGGADRAGLAEAQAREREAGHQLEWLRSGVALQVRSAYLDTAAASQRVQAARDSVEQARESLRIIQNRYDAGLVTITELLRSQTAELEARTGYLGALHDWEVARASLERAAGTLTADSHLLRQGEKP